MYFSQSIDDHRIEVFRILLQSTIEGYNGYKSEIDKVISEAKDLHLGVKDLYTIDKALYPLITLLEENGTDFLDSLNSVSDLTSNDYKNVLSIFQNIQFYEL